MKTIRTAVAVAFLAATAAAASAGTINVPADYATIRSALDASLDGDTVVVAAGTYTELLQMDQRNNVTLRAEGVVILTPASGKATTAGISLSSCQNVTVDGFTILKAPDAAITVSTCLNVSILNCTVLGAKGTGVVVYGGQDVTIADCTVTGTGKNQAGINGSSVAGPPTLRCRVLRCTVTKAGAAGIIVRGDASLVEDCVVNGSKKAGVELDRAGGAQGTTVRGCTIMAAGDSGIVAAGPSNSVEGNTITDSKNYGIAVVQNGTSTTTGVSVLGNTVTKTKKKDGILVAAPQCTIQGNTTSGTKGDGIRVSDTGSEITGNTVTEARGVGVHVYGSSHTVTGNTATGKKADFWDQSTGSVISGNTFVKIK